MKSIVYDFLKNRKIYNGETNHNDLLEEGIDLYVENFLETCQGLNKQLLLECLESFHMTNHEQVLAYFINYPKIIQLNSIYEQMHSMMDNYPSFQLMTESVEYSKLKKDYTNIYNQCIGDVSMFMFSLTDLEDGLKDDFYHGRDLNDTSI